MIKRLSLLIALLLMATPAWAVSNRDRYVNTASTAGGDGTTNGTAGATRAYATLAAAISAEATNLVTADVVLRIYCAGTTADSFDGDFTGYTTDAESLENLYARTEHPFLAHLLRHRDQIRLRQTVEGLLKSVADDGRIHTTYVQTIAATGRLSSTDPNLQNIPIRTEEGRRIREAFVVGEGYETLLTADYSQIEMRIMADQSSDAGLVEAFASGQDFHSTTASRVFGVPADQVTGAMRARIKAMNYGLAYGLSAFGLSQQLKIEVSEARGLMEEYFERFGNVRDYLHDIVRTAGKTGYTETLLGRRRYLPDLTSSNRQRREMAERMALNAPIQGSAADIIKVAMLDVESALAAERLQSRMLLQVHDELVFEVAPGEQDRMRDLVRDRMGHAMELAVPLEVSLGTGRSWHEAAH